MPRTLTFGFKVCLLELNVLIPRNKKLFRFDELRDELNIKWDKILGFFPFYLFLGVDNKNMKYFLNFYIHQNQKN